MRWIDSIKEAMALSLQELSMALRVGHCGHHSFMGSPEVRGNSIARNTTQSVRVCALQVCLSWSHIQPAQCEF